MKISIVLTVYNIEAYIKQCMDSVLGQTYKDIEVIVVDDCSPDKSMDIVRGYDDERIKIVTHSENMGAGWARRHGIEASTGDYVITVDGDDWLSEDFIEKLAEGAKKTNADIVSGGLIAVYEGGYEEVRRFAPRTSCGIQKFKDYAQKKIIFLANKIVRRSMYEKVPYCTRRYCEDTPVILPLLYYANKVVYVDTQGYYYRQHSTSLCHRVNVFEDALFKALCSKELSEFFDSKGAEYEGLISKPEFVGYMRLIKMNMTDELAEKYKTELGELMPALLKILNF